MYKVIIADDEVEIRALIRKLLDPLSTEVVLVDEVSDGEEVLNSFKTHKPDIILTDIRMPKMNGLDLLRKIKEISSDTIVILFSAYDDFEYASQALKEGASEYLLKPIEEEILYEAIKNAQKKLMSRHKHKKFIYEMKREIEKLKNQIISQNEESSSGQNEYDGKNPIEKAIHYINENYASDITLMDVAEKVCLYPTYLSELFKKETGQGFSEYLNELRIGKAKVLLSIPSLKVSEVARMVGFHDCGYFSKIFKRLNNQTPLEYKKQLE